MKKGSIMLLVIFLGNCLMFGHEQNVHRYIVTEAWKLLKYQKPELNNSLMANYIGGISNTDYLTSIVAGSHNEDVQDIIYMNCGFNLNFFGIELIPCVATTINHFWDADFGDNSIVTILGSNPNAFQKAENLWYGTHNFICGVSIANYGVADKIEHFGIPNLHNTGNIKWIGYWNSAGQYFSKNINQVYNKNYRHRVSYDILGRIAHLLADMSIPAHCHDDAHSPVSEEGKDNYEQWVMTNYSAYTWEDALAQGGTLFEASEKNYPIRYLMYVVNQYADFFPSDGSWMGLYYGDKNYSSTYTRDGKTDTYPILNSLFSNLGSIPTNINYTEQASSLMPLAIRATAGLLYLFAKEANLLSVPIPITGVNVSGTDILYQGATGVWGATAQNGLEPFTYNWEIKYVDGGGYLQSFASVKAEKEKKDKDKKKDGEIIINLAPSNEWVSLGLNSDVLTRPHNPTDLRDYYLKCSVTDASGTTKTSNEWFVDVTIDLPPVNPPLTKTVTDDNLKSEMNALSKENEVTESPKAYSLEQNYPNPFNPTTRISYSIAESGFVTLKVFDILGREVSTLVNEVKPAGKFEVEFNASELPTGTYIYRLTAGNYQTINKMLLLK